MDARDLLRKYIEQRREVGETELVLDGLNVEEVMRLLGAAGKAGQPGSGKSSSRSLRTSESAGTDWRATLRDAGAGAEPTTASPSSERSSAAPVEKAPAPVERVSRR